MMKHPEFDQMVALAERLRLELDSSDRKNLVGSQIIPDKSCRTCAVSAHAFRRRYRPGSSPQCLRIRGCSEQCPLRPAFQMIGLRQCYCAACEHYIPGTILRTANVHRFPPCPKIPSGNSILDNS